MMCLVAICSRLGLAESIVERPPPGPPTSSALALCGRLKDSYSTWLGPRGGGGDAASVSSNGLVDWEPSRAGEE